MSYEDSAGLNVHNQYGPRKTGGEAGRYNTLGATSNEFAVDLPFAGLYGSKMPVRNNIQITAIDLDFVTAGTVTHIAVGATAVYDSTSAVTLPVKIPSSSTGVVTITGGTAGQVILKYENISGDAFAY